MDNKVTTRITEREAAIKAWLKELEEVKGAKFPVLPERIYEALDTINVAIAIKEFTPDTIEMQDAINENSLEALVFEWYYDGHQMKGVCVEGILFETCLFTGKPSKTDLLTIPNHEGFEMDPELEVADEDEFYGFCIDPVMNVWYEVLSKEFDDKSEEYRDLNTTLKNGVDINMIENAYTELFHLKLVTLLREAHLTAFEKNPIQITTGKPFHIFIQRHERWPMHVLTLNE